VHSFGGSLHINAGLRSQPPAQARAAVNHTGSENLAKLGQAKGEVLVEPQWLQEHLHDPTLKVIEVDVSPLAYQQGHIQGAVLWNIDKDIKDINYQLVDKATTEALVNRSGIGPASTVVLYGYAPAIGFLAHEALRTPRRENSQLFTGNMGSRRPFLDHRGAHLTDQPLPAARPGQRNSRLALERARGNRRPHMHHLGRAHRRRVPRRVILAVRRP
jgi:hypothetical protein